MQAGIAYLAAQDEHNLNWNATLESCLRECEECHPEPTIADFERAVYEAKVKGGKA